MKTGKLVLTLLAAAWASGAMAQQAPEVRDVSIRVLNRKEKPLSHIVVQSTNGKDTGMTDKNGVYVFKNIADDDQIRLVLSSDRTAVIPVSGMDSVLVVMKKRGRYDYSAIQNDQRLNIGYGTVTRVKNTSSTSGLDVEAIVRETGATSLIDVLRGRVAGLDIRSDGTALMRGERSLLVSNEPLVFVNGSEFGTIKQASDALNIIDIKSVSVIKDGTMYGSRGANGVILITTK